MTKVQLIDLSRKLEVKGISKLRKEDLIKKLINEKSVKEILNCISPSYWKRNKNNIFGWTSIVGLVITIVGLVPKSIDKKNIKPSTNQNEKIVIDFDSIEFKNLVFSSAQELRKNKDFIFDLNWYFKDSSYNKPIGQLKFDETKKLFNTHFSKVLKYTYGEEKDLLQLVLKLEDANKHVANIKNSKDYRHFNDTHDMTFDDITFLNGFLFWYLSGIAQGELTPSMNDALGWSKNEDDFNRRIDTSNLDMKYLDYPDFGYVTSYFDYLGFID